jgi:hypothetical protein
LRKLDLNTENSKLVPVKLLQRIFEFKIVSSVHYCEARIIFPDPALLLIFGYRSKSNFNPAFCQKGILDYSVKSRSSLEFNINGSIRYPLEGVRLTDISNSSKIVDAVIFFTLALTIFLKD